MTVDEVIASKTPGRIAYEAYLAQIDMLNGLTSYVPWFNLPTAQKTSWEIAAQASFDEGFRCGQLSEAHGACHKPEKRLTPITQCFQCAYMKDGCCVSVRCEHPSIMATDQHSRFVGEIKDNPLIPAWCPLDKEK